jgi:hypothetical protein
VDVAGAIHIPLPAGEARQIVDDLMTGQDPGPVIAYFGRLDAAIEQRGGIACPFTPRTPG